jgi:hypothetical protein
MGAVVPRSKTKELAAVLKVINALEDAKAAKKKRLHIIQKLKLMRLPKPLRSWNTASRRRRALAACRQNTRAP